MPRLTGERPLHDATPDSILALHRAGYRAVAERLGPGRMLDLGCGLGFESVTCCGPGRQVIGVDYDVDTLAEARRLFAGLPVHAACMDASCLGVRRGSANWICSSHLIEHFRDPAAHAAEVAAVLSAGGTAFFLTPNAPADFENPFHVHLFQAADLDELLSRHFRHVSVMGIDGSERVKMDFELRRRRARRVLALDPFHLRRRIPHSWYRRAYMTLLPVAYRLLASGASTGTTGITADDFFVTGQIDHTTPVLMAVASDPRPSRTP